MKKLILSVLFIALLGSCGGGGSEDPIPTALNPEPSLLLFPAKDSECITGTSTATLKSTIVFNWNKSANTDSYDLALKDLKSGIVTNYPSTTNQVSIELSKGTPYSWYVTSKSGSVSKTAVSETWKFYAAGDGIVNYAPFPAEAVAPLKAATITATDGKITLDWTATDIDADISSYDVFLGTDLVPSSFKTELTDSILTAVPVTAGSTYYWYIVTKDKQGNTSKSEIFTFSVKK